jgi:POT family proton-dependent oligopeptide transporter
VIFAAATMLLAGAPLMAGADGLAPLWIPVLFHLVSNWGGAYFSPVMQTFYAARAPEQWRGSLLGVDALSVSVASILSGAMGSWYETTTPPLFWTATAAIAGVAGVLVLLARGALRRWLGPEQDEG